MTDTKKDAQDDKQQPSPEAVEEQSTSIVDHPIHLQVEALLLSTERPLPARRLAELTKTDNETIEQSIETLNEDYEASDRSFRVSKVAGGFQLLTTASFGPLMARLHTDRQVHRLSPAALETLSVIAYRQPIMRAEIEAIRGVACGEVLRGLMERRLVKIVGRAEVLGRPMLYGSTKEFLNIFGMSGLDDLPDVDGLKREPSYRPPRNVETKPDNDADDSTAPDGTEAASSDGEQEQDSAVAADATPVIEIETPEKASTSEG